MQNHKCNEVENAFPIFIVSCLSRILPFLRVSVACLFKRSLDLDVARDLGHDLFEVCTFTRSRDNRGPKI